MVKVNTDRYNYVAQHKFELPYSLSTLKPTLWALKVVCMVSVSFAKRKLAGHRVKQFSDHQGVKYTTCSGSKKEHQQAGAVAFYVLCLIHSINLEVEWITQNTNEYPNDISRIVDYMMTGSLIPICLPFYMLCGVHILLIVLLHWNMHNH